MKLLDVLLLIEDVNIEDLHPELAGFYSFLQALNKIGTVAPLPIPTINIIPNYKLTKNPGNFSFDRNSFKIEINPKIGNVDFTDAGHDIFHSITVGMAQKFARQKAKENKSQKAFLSPEDKAAKFNLEKNVNLEKQFRNTMSNLGFDVPGQIAPDYLNQLEKQIVGLPNESALSDIIKYMRSGTITKTHYQKSVNISPMKGVSRQIHPQAAKKYGDFKTLNLQQVLPQYDLEEDFGNKIAVAIGHFIKKSKPIDIEEIETILDDLSYVGMSHNLTQEFATRYKDFLMKLCQTYNNLLLRYKRS